MSTMPTLTRNRGTDLRAAVRNNGVRIDDAPPTTFLRHVVTEPPSRFGRYSRPARNANPLSFCCGAAEGYDADYDRAYQYCGGGAVFEEESSPASSDGIAPLVNSNSRPRRASLSASSPGLLTVPHQVSASSSKCSGIFPNVPRHGRPKSGKRRREEREEFERERAESFAALHATSVDLDRSSFVWARELQAKKKCAREEGANGGDIRNAIFPTYVRAPVQEEATTRDVPETAAPHHFGTQQQQHAELPRFLPPSNAAAFPIGLEPTTPAAPQHTTPKCATRFVPGFGFVFDTTREAAGTPSSVPSLPTGFGGGSAMAGPGLGVGPFAMFLGMEAPTSSPSQQEPTHEKTGHDDRHSQEQAAIAFLRMRLNRQIPRASVMVPPGA